MKIIRRIKPFDIFNYAFFFLLAFLAIYPLWYCVVGSFITHAEYLHSSVLIWPRQWTFEAYQFVFDQGQILSPMRVSATITIVGTVVNLAMSTTMAYGMSKRYPGSTGVAVFVIATMILSAGLIPNYILYRYLGILNTMAVYILPSMINTFYLIILRTNFQSFSVEIEEAAIIDGCTQWGVFLRIVLPLSKAILATIALFVAVDYWNTYSTSVYYVMDPSKKTLQHYLYQILGDKANNASSGGAMLMEATGSGAVFSENIKLANTVIAIVPILIVYPFLQRYFTNGIMVGALKG